MNGFSYTYVMWPLHDNHYDTFTHNDMVLQNCEKIWNIFTYFMLLNSFIRHNQLIYIIQFHSDSAQVTHYKHGPEEI